MAKVGFAQVGIAHAHAADKVAVLKANPDVTFCGVYEPDPDVRSERGVAQAYEGVHWYASENEIMQDDSIVAIAVEGEVSVNLEVARRALERGKHVWLDKPAVTTGASSNR